MSSTVKKIGIDVRVLMDSNYSGIPEFTLKLVENLLKIDTVNQYFLCCNSLSGVNDRIWDFAKNYKNVEIVQTKYPNKIYNYIYLKLLKRPKIDLKLGLDVFFMPHLNFVALGNESKKIITVHDLSFMRYGEFFSSRKNFWHFMISHKKLLNSFDTVIAISENTKRDIIDLCGVSQDKIKVIHSGVSDEYRIINKDDTRLLKVKEKYNLGDKVILYLGTIEPRKNVEAILNSFERLLNNEKYKDYELVLAGGKGWKSANIYKTWKASKVKDKIKFLGYVKKEDKVYLYNSANVFVYPSFYEGFGFPPLEALLCGAKVVTSHSSSLPEVIKDNAILIDPYNENEITIALKIAISSQVGVDKSIEISDIIKNSYNWQKTVEEYLSIF